MEMISEALIRTLLAGAVHCDGKLVAHRSIMTHEGLEEP